MKSLAVMLMLISTPALADPLDPLFRDTIMGSYGKTEICQGTIEVYQIFHDRVSFGEGTCDIAWISDKMGDEAFQVDLTGCQLEGEPGPDRSITLVTDGVDGLRIVGDIEANLQRCVDLE